MIVSDACITHTCQIYHIAEIGVCNTPKTKAQSHIEIIIILY